MRISPASHLRAVITCLVTLLAMTGCGEETADPLDAASADSTALAEIQQGDRSNDHALVGETVERFHAALEAGDSATALGMLETDAVILEGGSVETVDEYRAGHLAADMNFAQGLRAQREVSRVTVEGDVAWTVAQSVSDGEIENRQISSQGVELMVLNRRADGWRIAAIHWSSRDVPE